MPHSQRSDRKTPRATGEDVRLQAFLARAGVASRRACEELIAGGRVKVNGATVTAPGSKVRPGTDRVEVDGRPVGLQEIAWIALHKPKGYVTSRKDQFGRKTIYELLPEKYHSLFHVGRLDRDSEGVLLLTNDGNTANRMLHPSAGVTKEYLADVEGKPTAEQMKRLTSGVEIEGGLARAESVVRLHEVSQDVHRLRIVLREGKKREIRRMLDAVEHPVKRLIRTRFGPVELGELKKGKWRVVAPTELSGLGKPGKARKPAPDDAEEREKPASDAAERRPRKTAPRPDAAERGPRKPTRGADTGDRVPRRSDAGERGPRRAARGPRRPTRGSDAADRGTRKPSSRSDAGDRPRRPARDFDAEDRGPRRTAREFDAEDRGPRRPARGADSGDRSSRKPARDFDAEDRAPRRPGSRSDAGERGPRRPARESDASDRPRKPARESDASDRPRRPARGADAADRGPRKPARGSDAGERGGSRSPGAKPGGAKPGGAKRGPGKPEWAPGGKGGGGKGRGPRGR